MIRHDLFGSVSGRESIHQCQCCQLGKQIQLSYYSSESVSQRPFALVHLGPLLLFLKDINFIDVFSCHTRIYFMKHQIEALTIYKAFSAMIHTRFNTPIRVFRADSASEYLFDVLC